MIRVSSFDVFDTCLLRRVAFPSDLFLELASRLRGDRNAEVDWDWAEAFRAARIKAEKRARAKSRSEEVTLRSIWQELTLMIQGFEDADRGAELELDAERSCLRPNLNVLSLVSVARQKGKRVAFVSDTYLPAAFLQEMLSRFGFMECNDILLTSSEKGVTKCSGNLFRHLLSAACVRPSEVEHLGDNSVSDYKTPQVLGIRAKLYRSSSFSPSEEAVVRCGGAPSSRLAAAMRLARLSPPRRVQSSSLQRFVADFAGPFLLTFAAWVLRQASRNGQRRLYFLSRDGYLLWRIAAKIAGSSRVECRYLMVSRQALFLPSASEVSEVGMPWMRRSFETPTLGSLLAKIELDSESAKPLTSQWEERGGLGTMLESEDDWVQFWKYLQMPSIRARVEQTARRRKETAVSYLRSQGLLDGTPFAIVDFGWHLACQAALRSLLDAPGGQPRRLHGYYLGLTIDRESPATAGYSTALFHFDPSDSARFRSSEVSDRATLIEHLFGLAPHGTVHHYKSSGGSSSPVHAEVSREMGILSENASEVVEEFASANCDIVEELGEPDIARDVLGRLSSAAFRHPDVGWLEAVSSLRVSSDQNNLGSQSLCEPWTWLEHVASWLPYRLRNRLGIRLDRPWIEAIESVRPRGGTLRRSVKRLLPQS